MIRVGPVHAGTPSFSGVSWRRRSRLRTVVLLAITVAGLIVFAATVWAVAASRILVHRTGDVVWGVVFAAACVAVRACSSWRRARGRLGSLAARTEFLYAVPDAERIWHEPRPWSGARRSTGWPHLVRAGARDLVGRCYAP